MKSRAFPTADMELRTLTVGGEVYVRQDSPGAAWKRMVVEALGEGDTATFRDPDDGQATKLQTESLHIDLPE